MSVHYRQLIRACEKVLQESAARFPHQNLLLELDLVMGCFETLGGPRPINQSTQNRLDSYAY